MERKIATAEALTKLAREFGPAAATSRAHRFHGPAHHAWILRLLIEREAAKANPLDRPVA